MNLLNPAIPPNTVGADRLKAVVLDWAGTTVDFGSVAPARTLQRLFATKGLTLTDQEIRRDMGLPKKDHIRGILSTPRIREAWTSLYGAVPQESEVDAMYEQFIPLQFSCLAQNSSVIPGVAHAVESFRTRGLKIGSTTGYTRGMLDMLVDSAAQEGYTPDCHITPGEAGAGRPHPFMMYACAIRLQVYPMAAIAKIGDTPADIKEGLNAGAWSIGVAATGNGIGLTQSEFNSLSEQQRQQRLESARTELAQAGAHFVIDDLTELGPVLDTVDHLLRSKSAIF